MEGIVMAKFVCDVCGYIYDEDLGDPDAGIEPGTKFEDLPDDKKKNPDDDDFDDDDVDVDEDADDETEEIYGDDDDE